jgi:5-methylthioadenosine/S-adenosylhomocysteine deaminase
MLPPKPFVPLPMHSLGLWWELIAKAAPKPLSNFLGLDVVAVSRANAHAKVARAVIAPMVADLTFYQAVPGLIDALPDDARDRTGKMRMGQADATVAL